MTINCYCRIDINYQFFLQGHSVPQNVLIVVQGIVQVADGAIWKQAFLHNE